LFISNARQVTAPEDESVAVDRKSDASADESVPSDC